MSTGYAHDKDSLAEVMIAKHCEWLNLWTTHEARQHPDWGGAWTYRSDQFQLSQENPYGWRKVLGVIYDAEADAEMLILTVMIYDGDEGGPQTLTGFFDARITTYYRDKAGTIFTLDSVDWSKYSDTLAEGNCEHDHTELNEWVLDSMVQEFDTDRRLVWEDGAFANTPESQGYSNGLRHGVADDEAADDGAEHEFGKVEGCEACETKGAN